MARIRTIKPELGATIFFKGFEFIAEGKEGFFGAFAEVCSPVLMESHCLQSHENLRPFVARECAFSENIQYSSHVGSVSELPSPGMCGFCKAKATAIPLHDSLQNRLIAFVKANSQSQNAGRNGSAGSREVDTSLAKEEPNELLICYFHNVIIPAGGTDGKN